MAEEKTTGVKPADSSPEGGKSKKQKKLLMIGGAGLAGILLLSHKGANQTPGGSDGAQAGLLLDAYQQGIQDAAGIQTGTMGVGSAGGSSMGNGSGSSGFSPPPSSGNGSEVASEMPREAPSGSIVIPPPGSASYDAKFNKNWNKKWEAKQRAKGHGKSGHGKGPGKPSSVQHHEHHNHVHPSQPHHARPAPADHSGHHPETHHTTRRGHRRHSPVVVEAMDGAGHGVTVMGRDFPGATGHRLGSPRHAPSRGIIRDVSVFYGGRTEVHTVAANGSWWMDNTPGRNPLQNRTIPHVEDHKV